MLQYELEKNQVFNFASIRLVFTSLVLLISLSAFAENNKKTKELDFYLEYSTPSKTLIIKGTTITIQEWLEEYDNPSSSMPSKRKEGIKTASIPMTEILLLKKVIRSNGFMKLTKTDYGAIAENRYYPYSIIVKMNGKQKKILYRSSPDPANEIAPKAFSEVEKMVTELVDGLKSFK